MEKSKKKKNKNFVLYYGVHIEIETERKLLSTAQTALNELLTKFSPDFETTYNTLTELIKKYDEAKKGNTDNFKSNTIITINNMSYPKSFHITIAFGGKKGFNKNSEAVKGFDPGKSVKFKPLGLVIVPGKIAIIPVTANIDIENEFPHFTTFIGDFKPKESNFVLENLFGKNKKLEKEYNDVVQNNETISIKKESFELGGDCYDAYVYLTSKNEELEGRMRGYNF